MRMPQLIPLVSFHRSRGDRRVRVAHNVDVLALWRVATRLGKQGYDVGPFLLNHPDPFARDGGDVEPIHVDLDAFARDDLILTATRLDIDPQSRNRKRVVRGETPLEVYVERAWAQFIECSERLQVVLQPFTKGYFEPGYANRRNVEFLERENARYKGLPDDRDFRPSTKDRRTAGYMLRRRELWPGGPGYLGFFGMNSTTGIVWSQLLYHRHHDLLEQEGFFMAELEGETPGRVGDLAWALDWDSKIILRAPIGSPSAKSASSTRMVPSAQQLATA